jgi:hypothetical protein
MACLRRQASVLVLAGFFVFRFACLAAAATECSNTSNFNGTTIAGGNYVWFNSAFSLPGFDPSHVTAPLTISFTGVTIRFSTFSVTAPNASITYDPAATTANTTFDALNNQWVTTLPTTHLAGNAFLDAAAFLVPATGLPGGIQSVTWQGTFRSSSSGLKVQWQWAAAVYTSFNSDYNAIGVKPVDDNQASAYKNSDHAGTPEDFTAYVIGGATGGGGSNYTGSYSGTVACPVMGVPLPSACQAISALSTLVVGKNVTSYIPKGAWHRAVTGVSVVNVEGTSVTPTLIATPNVVNSCASNSVTGQTVCSANNTDVYLLTGPTLNSTLTSSGNGILEFSGGECTNCGVMMDAVHNKAVISLSVAGVGGFQSLDLASSTPIFEPAFASEAPGGPFYPGNTSENPLIDPVNNLLLSASESNNYEIISLANPAKPGFFEHPIPNPDFALVADSSTEDCTTGIAIAPYEFVIGNSQVYLADLTQATFIPGSPGKWTLPATGEQIQTLSESVLTAGRLGTGGGSSVAQGTHTGVITGEFGGNKLTAVALPQTSGSGTPAFSDWVTCSIPSTFTNGEDPHTVTSYQSPSSGHAVALLVGNDATVVAAVDLTMMLDPTIVARTAGGHGCMSGTLPPTVVRFMAVP